MKKYVLPLLLYDAFSYSLSLHGMNNGVGHPGGLVWYCLSKYKAGEGLGGPCSTRTPAGVAGEGVRGVGGMRVPPLPPKVRSPRH